MMSELVLAALAIIVAGILAARAYDRFQARRTARLRIAGDAFYASAFKLMTNGEVTPEVLRLLDFMALSVSEPSLVWDWLKMLNRRRRSSTRPRPLAPIMTDSVRDDFIAMTIAGLSFIAELHPMPGVVILRHVEHLRRRGRQDPEKVEKAAKAIERWAHIDMTGDRRKRACSSTSTAI